jgi:O-antigen/teichoic acid export membrane protein
MGITGFLGIMNLGLGEATLRFVAYYFGRKDLEGINRVIGATFFVYSLSALAVGLGMFFGAPHLVKILAIPPKDFDLGTKLLRVTAINFGFVSIMTTFGAVPKALQRFDIDAKLLFFQSVVQVLGTVVILSLGYGIYELLLWTLAAAMATIFVTGRVIKKLIPRIVLLPRPSRAGLREVFGYGIYSMVSNILGTIWSQADRILLGTMVSAASVGYLSAPKNLTLRANSAVSEVGSVLFPKFSALQDPEEIKRLFLDATWLLLGTSIVIFVPLTVLFPDFLRLWINPDFALKSAWVGQVIAFSCLVRGSFVPYENLFRGLGKPKYLSIIHFGSGITSLALNLILIPRYGLAGAGYSFLITIFWGFGAIVFSWKRVLGMESIRPLFPAVLFPILSGIITTIAAIAIRSNLGTPGWFGLIILGLVFFLIAAGLIILVEIMFSNNSSRLLMLKNILYKIKLNLNNNILKHKTIL